MKQILYALVALVAVVGFTSCKEDNKGKVLDPLAKISIKPAAMPQSTASKAQYLSPKEIVRLTTDIVLISPLYPNEPYTNFGISEEQKDLTIPKITLWGMWVIENGQLSRDFVEAKDVIFVTREGQLGWNPISDTLAYIPNAQLRAAEKTIKAAFAAENYDEVYRLFDEAYKFTPINGADWLKLNR